MNISAKRVNKLKRQVDITSPHLAYWGRGHLWEARGNYDFWDCKLISKGALGQ